MSEYMEKHSVSRLIGAPPGYVGYDEGGQLTEAVRRRPYSVILFDEVEKAHQDIFNVLLQLLDDGRLTDGQGRQIDFKNTIIIMTSNIGSQVMREAKNLDDVRDEIFREINSFFKPEFLNRLDDIILFHKLDKTHIAGIIRIQLGYLKDRLLEKHIDLKFTDKSVEFLANVGYDPQFGARPLKRAIQTYIENEIAKHVIAGTIKENDVVKVDSNGQKIVFMK
jgi:ATP-dependent Clp protease ATP-binding subunit ClpB